MPLRSRERRGTPAELLVIGLGNPGAEYERTRHNLGAEVVATLAKRHGGALKRGRELALTAEVRVDGRLLALAFPQTYVNESGASVRPSSAATGSTTCAGWSWSTTSSTWRWVASR